VKLVRGRIVRAMPQYLIPHEIYYETPEPASIQDVIESLLGIEDILKEIGPLLEVCMPGLTIESIQVSIKEISDGSLKEVVMAAIFLTFQKDLEVEVPNLIEHIFGTRVGYEYPTITSICFLLVLFYGADFVYQRINKAAIGSRIREQLDGLVTEVASECRLPETKIRKFLEDRYAKGHMRSLVRSTLRFFRPSKQQGNSAIRVGQRRIEPRVVAEFPGDAQMLEFEEPPPTRMIQDVEIELHAQDMDHTRQGWAAVIPSLSKRRVRLELYPPIRPIDIYTRQKVRGDVLVMYRHDAKGQLEPSVYHLVRLKDQPAAVPPAPVPQV
jgi:hypothetical protein